MQNDIRSLLLTSIDSDDFYVRFKQLHQVNREDNEQLDTLLRVISQLPLVQDRWPQISSLMPAEGTNEVFSDFRAMDLLAGPLRLLFTAPITSLLRMESSIRGQPSPKASTPLFNSNHTDSMSLAEHGRCCLPWVYAYAVQHLTPAERASKDGIQWWLPPLLRLWDSSVLAGAWMSATLQATLALVPVDTEAKEMWHRMGLTEVLSDAIVRRWMAVDVAALTPTDVTAFRMLVLDSDRTMVQNEQLRADCVRRMVGAAIQLDEANELQLECAQWVATWLSLEDRQQRNRRALRLLPLLVPWWTKLLTTDDLRQHLQRWAVWSIQTFWIRMPAYYGPWLVALWQASNKDMDQELSKDLLETLRQSMNQCGQLKQFHANLKALALTSDVPVAFKPFVASCTHI